MRNSLGLGLLAIAVLAVQTSCSPSPEMPTNVEPFLKPQDRLIHAIEIKNLDAVRQALAAGGDPNNPGSGELPPLHVAAVHSFVEGGRLLISHNANVNQLSVRQGQQDGGQPVERPGNAPLHAAVMVGDVEFAKLLIENKADVNVHNGRGMTPLDIATSRSAMLKGLEAAAQSPDRLASLTETMSKNEAVITLLKEHGAVTTQDIEAKKLDKINGGGIIGQIPKRLSAPKGPGPRPAGASPSPAPDKKP